MLAFATLYILSIKGRLGSLALEVVLGTLGRPLLLCTWSSRMFFRMKSAVRQDFSTGADWTSYSHSAIRFVDLQDSEAR